MYNKNKSNSINNKKKKKKKKKKSNFLCCSLYMYWLFIWILFQRMKEILSTVNNCIISDKLRELI